jgi:hypothetical protein
MEKIQINLVGIQESRGQSKKTPAANIALR